MYLTISNFKSFQKQIIQSDQSQGILKKPLGKNSIISTAYNYYWSATKFRKNAPQVCNFLNSFV